jgi:putative flippase GtrA
VGPGKRLLSYAGVSAIVMPLNLLTAWLLTVGGLHYLLATVAGYVVHTVLVFVLNHRWTFKHAEVKRRSALAKTFVVHGGSFLIVLGVTSACVEFLGIGFLISRLFASACAGGWDFLLDSHFTFGVHPLR